MFPFKKEKEIELFAPVVGKAIDLKKVSDEVFSSGMMGEGIAFKPCGQVIYAPCDGRITFLANTKHAIGIRSKNKAEILIHVGFDTVNYQGEGFTAFKSVGDKVKKGEKLLEVDIDFFASKNVNITTPMIITNSKEFLIDMLRNDEEVELESQVMRLKPKTK